MIVATTGGRITDTMSAMRRTPDDRARQITRLAPASFVLGGPRSHTLEWRHRMTIDERMEALTQTVELLASLPKNNEKLMGEMMLAITQLARTARAQR